LLLLPLPPLLLLLLLLPGFWGFMFAGCCHYWGMFWYFLPGGAANSQTQE
jgi:hypothetical protein